jgi:hypothetical protein
LVSHAEEPKMPPRQDKLVAAKLDLIKKWIEQGAPENAGSKVTVKKNPLAAWLERDGKPKGRWRCPRVAEAADHGKPGRLRAGDVLGRAGGVAGQKQVALTTESGDLPVFCRFEGIPYVVRFSRNGSVLMAAGGRGGIRAAWC